MSIRRLSKLVKILRALGWEYRGSYCDHYAFTHREVIAEGQLSLLRRG